MVGNGAGFMRGLPSCPCLWWKGVRGKQVVPNPCPVLGNGIFVSLEKEMSGKGFSVLDVVLLHWFATVEMCKLMLILSHVCLIVFLPFFAFCFFQKIFSYCCFLPYVHSSWKTWGLHKFPSSFYPTVFLCFGQCSMPSRAFFLHSCDWSLHLDDNTWVNRHNFSWRSRTRGESTLGCCHTAQKGRADCSTLQWWAQEWTRPSCF